MRSISETIMCSWLGLVGVQCRGVTFDLVVVTLTFKILSGLYLGNSHNVQKVDT